MKSNIKENLNSKCNLLQLSRNHQSRNKNVDGLLGYGNDIDAK